MNRIFFTITVSFFLVNFKGGAQEKVIDFVSQFKNVKSSELLIMGSFHFKDQGLDDFKVKYPINIKEEKRQIELLKIVDLIAEKYAPTKVAVEYKKSKQNRLDSLYKLYLEGKYKLPKNEAYQIGFRLAKKLNHDRVYAVDVQGKYYSNVTNETFQKKQKYFIGKASPEQLQREMNFGKLYNQVYENEDKSKLEMQLLNYFHYLNDPKRISWGHGQYLTGSFKLAEKNDYYGPDMSTKWYNRNLRIFSNLLQIDNPGKDKIFLIIGSGHLPILDFLAKSSPDFKLKNFNKTIK